MSNLLLPNNAHLFLTEAVNRGSQINFAEPNLASSILADRPYLPLIGAECFFYLYMLDFFCNFARFNY